MARRPSFPNPFLPAFPPNPLLSAFPASPKIEPPYQRFEVPRDGGLPLEFDGNIIAVIEQDDRGADVTPDTMLILRAAIYRTRAGKFIAEFSRYTDREVASWGKSGPPKLFDKAAVFGTLEEAIGFFRPGRLTNALLAELGVQRTEFIE